jgi:hypothetical protein
MLAGPAYRIVTDRLILRCYDPRDAPALTAAVDAQFRCLFDLGQDFVYGIFDRDDATVLGGTGRHPRVGDRAREIATP